MMSVHEKGRNIIIQSDIFEWIIEPRNIPTNYEESQYEDLSYLQTVILSAISERQREGASTSYQDLMRNSNDYFLKTTIKGVENILKQTKKAALRLQAKYYECMREVLRAAKGAQSGGEHDKTCYR